MLAISEQALAQGRPDVAQAILEALIADPRLEVRNEARFRLAILAQARRELQRAALLLRAILDEQPGAQRVRLELAKVLGEIGDMAAARRELRQVQSGSLPPDVARVVDRFSAALREYKRFGGDFEVAIAPDTNVNRATRSDVLGTVLGPFDIDEESQARSGIGLTVRGSAYARVPVSSGVDLVGQATLDANLYRHERFGDVIAQVAFGPELQVAKGRAQVQTRFARRWAGGERYSDTPSAALGLEMPIGQTAQVRLSVEGSRTRVIPNSLQDNTGITVSGAIEKALSPRAGVSLTLTASRHAARAPAYSDWSGQIGVLGWREAGRMTFVASASYARLQADERLSLFPLPRRDDSIRLVLAATLRQITIAGFAPQLRATWERNASSIGIYQYSRLRGEVGVVRAF